MNKLKATLLSVIILFSLVTPLAFAQDSKQITIVANSIDKPLFSLVEVYLESEGFQLVYISAEEFQTQKENSRILILGGPNSPEGIGEIVQDILSDSDQEHLREEKGNRGLYKFRDTYADEQQINIVAGFDRFDTRQAAQTEQRNIFSEEIKQSDKDNPIKLRINIESVDASYHTARGSGTINSISYTSTNIGNVSSNSSVDLFVYYIEGDPEELVHFDTDITEIWSGVIFKPNENRYETIIPDIRLPFAGKYAVELSILGEGNTDPVDISRKEFTVR